MLPIIVHIIHFCNVTTGDVVTPQAPGGNYDGYSSGVGRPPNHGMISLRKIAPSVLGRGKPNIDLI